MSASLEKLRMAVGLMREVRDAVVSGARAMNGGQLSQAEICVDALLEFNDQIIDAVGVAVSESAMVGDEPVPFELQLSGGLN